MKKSSSSSLPPTDSGVFVGEEILYNFYKMKYL